MAWNFAIWLFPTSQFGESLLLEICSHFLVPPLRRAGKLSPCRLNILLCSGLLGRYRTIECGAMTERTSSFCCGLILHFHFLLIFPFFLSFPSVSLLISFVLCYPVYLKLCIVYNVNSEFIVITFYILYYIIVHYVHYVSYYYCVYAV